MLERQTRCKLTLEEIIEKWKRPYMSIIFLTSHFQEKGLQLLHYRYALVSNPNIIIDCEEDMKEFFGWKLRSLYDLKEIEKCISSTENLSKYLKKLVQLGAIQRIADEHFKNLATYKINKKCFEKINFIIRKTRLINKIRTCSEPLFTKLEKNINEEYRQQYLRGLDNSSLPEQFKKELTDISKELFT